MIFVCIPADSKESIINKYLCFENVDVGSASIGDTPQLLYKEFRLRPMKFNFLFRKKNERKNSIWISK